MMIIRALVTRFVCGLAYYGISYSAESLGGDLFLNSLISGLVEYPAYIICFLIVGHPRIGRKYSMAGSFFVGGVSLLVCIPLLINPGISKYSTVCFNVDTFVHHWIEYTT